MKNISKIVFIHSLNNFTGSPNVLSLIIKALAARGYKIDVITSRGDGFVSNIEGINYRHTCYRWLGNKWLTAILLLLSQIELFFKILLFPKRNVVYYLNTITPFAAAWACRLSNKNYIYHVHENMQHRKPTYGLHRWTYKYCNRKTIFVSYYLKTTALNCKDGTVIYNSLASDFIDKAQKHHFNGGKLTKIQRHI